MIEKRIYISSVEKSLLKDISSVQNFQELQKKSNFQDIYDTNVENIFKVPLLIDLPLIDIDISIINKYSEELFVSEEINKYYQKDNLVIFSKHGLEKIIDIYHESNRKYYLNLLNKYDRLMYGKYDNKKEKELDILEVHTHFHNYHNEWKNKDIGWKPYNISKDKPFINSWKKEYLIFNLVKIYRDLKKEEELILYII